MMCVCIIADRGHHVKHISMTRATLDACVLFCPVVSSSQCHATEYNM